MNKFIFIIVSFICCSCHAETITPDQVTSIYDGDTITVELDGVREKVRVVGVDTPELRTKCQSEKVLARRAKELTVATIRQGKVIELKAIKRNRDRYGRLLRSVIIDGKDLADTLIQEGLGREYHGGKRVSWCVNSCDQMDDCQTTK